MKSSYVFLEKLPTQVSKKSKPGQQKTSPHSIKFRSKKIEPERYGLPPMAPHNTTQDIFELHPEILFDEEDLLGSCGKFFDIVA